MKKLKKFVALFMVLAMMLTAVSCGKAPAQNEKTETGTTETDKTTKADALSNEENVPPPADEPTNAVYNFVSEDGKVTFEIDAAVTGDDITSLPVVTVSVAEFTAEELEQITLALADGSMVTAYNESVPKVVLEDMLAEKKAYVSDRDYLMDYYGGNEETVERRIETVNGEIAQIEADLENCPEFLPADEPEYIYKPDTDYDEGNSYIHGWYSDNVDSFRALTVIGGSYKQINVVRRDDAHPYISYISLDNDYRYGTESQRSRWKCYQTEPFTADEIEDAKSDVLNTLSDMGLGNWKIISCEVGEISLDEFYNGNKNTDGLVDTTGMRYDLFFRLEPEYNDVGQLVDSWGYRSPAMYNDRQYDSQVEAPYMTIIYSGGKIIEFWGIGLMKTEGATEEQKLLPYDEAMEAICARLAETWGEDLINEHCDFINYAYDPGADVMEYVPVVNVEGASAYKVEVDRIELKYVRTETEDGGTEFELIPVWAVYGSPIVSEYTRGNSVANARAEIPYGMGVEIPLILVNAIDGSRVMLSDK